MSTAQPIQNSLKAGKWIRSTCKMCLHSCGSLIHVTDAGIINKIEGDPTNPSNNGKLCPKGNSAIMRHYDPNRFKQPLKRTNPEKGPNVDPMWEPISWDEALRHRRTGTQEVHRRGSTQDAAFAGGFPENERLELAAGIRQPEQFPVGRHHVRRSLSSGEWLRALGVRGCQ
jgi:anaerobic selenocysteine-containing dehydrogenase